MKQYDYSLLLGKMRERNETQASIAAVLGISAGTLNAKLNNKTEFVQSEIIACSKHLGIQDITKYFFVERL